MLQNETFFASFHTMSYLLFRKKAPAHPAFFTSFSGGNIHVAIASFLRLD